MPRRQTSFLFSLFLSLLPSPSVDTRGLPEVIEQRGLQTSLRIGTLPADQVDPSLYRQSARRMREDQARVVAAPHG